MNSNSRRPRVILYTICMLAGWLQSSAQAPGLTKQGSDVPPGETRTQPTDDAKPKASFVIAPSLSWVTSTQDQTQEGGTALLSVVKSRSFCDKNTRQAGVVGTASNSNTTPSSGPSTLLSSNDVRAEALFGFAGEHSENPEHIDITQNYFSGYADMFINNSLGIGLQQVYTVNYQRYLTRCLSVQSPQRFFASLTAGAGFINERLYQTTDKVNSAVIPISGQFSYILTKPKQPAATGQPLKIIFSAQAGYTPLLNDMHAYQAYANGSFQFPTGLSWLTISLNEMDIYMNNAPAGFKRNYQSGSIQLAFSFGGSSNTNPEYPGACYTADALNHLYCYDQVAASECSPPGVFRPGGRCSAVH